MYIELVTRFDNTAVATLSNGIDYSQQKFIAQHLKSISGNGWILTESKLEVIFSYESTIEEIENTVASSLSEAKAKLEAIIAKHNTIE
jgi:hypothetical protein